MSDDVERVLRQASESDTRFQYDIIKGLAESIRQQTTLMHDIQTELKDVATRLARIEANKISEEVARLAVKVETLEVDLHRRQGAVGVGTWLLKSPVFAYIAAVATAVIAFVSRTDGAK